MKSVRVFAACISTVVMGVAFGCMDTSGGKSGAPEPVATEAQAQSTPTELIEQKCAGPYKNPGSCNACVRGEVGQLIALGVISKNQGGPLISSFASGACQNACIPLTCPALPACLPVQSDGCGGTLQCCPSGEVCCPGLIGEFFCSPGPFCIF